MTNYNINSLLEALEKSSNSNSGIIFIDKNGTHNLSYKELFLKAKGIAGYLKSRVSNPNSEIIIYLGNNIEFVPVFWSCIVSQIIAVPVSIGSSDEHKLKLLNVWKSLIDPYIITTKLLLESIKDFSEKNGFDDIYGELKGKIILLNEIKKDENYVLPEINTNRIAFIQYSSGSTGFPKGVILTHKNLIVTTTAFINITNVNKNDSFLSWFPLTHDMGLIGWHIVPVVVGINQVLIETSLFVRSPAIWMDKSTEYKSTILCSPNFGLKHFLSFTKKLNNADWNLNNVRLIANGAEPISSDLCNEFMNALKQYGLKDTTVTPGYGLAEVGLIASISDYKSVFEKIYVDRKKLNVGQRIANIKKDSIDSMAIVCEGDVIPEMNVKIKNDNGQDLDEEYVGNIYLKGDSVTSGYYNNKRATEKIIVDGWLNTGDLGFLKNNKLFITGRSKELIIVNGYNYYPYDIERVCFEIDELDFGKVVAAAAFDKALDQEVLLIFVYFKQNFEQFVEIGAKIKEIVLKNIGLSVHKIIPVKKIPKTTSGKIQRFILVNEYINGTYEDILFELNEISAKSIGKLSKVKKDKDFITNEILALIKKVINIKNLDSNEALINYGVDSIRGIELLGIIKEYYCVEISEFIYLPDLSLTKIVDIIFNRLQEKSDKTEELNNNISNAASIKEYTASIGQFAIFYHYKNHPLSPAYNISLSCRILNNIEKDKLEQAYNYVINRHEILQSRYYMLDKLYYKLSNNSENIIVEQFVDEENYNKIKTIIKKQIETPFDIENNSIIRCYLYNTKTHGLIFVLNLHHIAGDARSLFLISQEIFKSYNELVKDNSVKTLAVRSESKFSDYVNEEIKYLNNKSANVAKEYWRTQLKGVDFGITIYDNNKVAKEDKYSSYIFEIERTIETELNTLSGFVVMLSAYCYLLHRYSHQEELVVGIPVSDNRVISDKIKNEELVGYVINTLPIKSRLDEFDTVETYLMRMKQTILNSMENQYYPFLNIVNDLNPNRESGANLLQTMFTMLPVSVTNQLKSLINYNEENEVINYGQLQIKPYYIYQQESMFNLSIEMVEYNKKDLFRISYNEAFYSKQFINRFVEHFKHIIKEIFPSHMSKLSTTNIILKNEKELLERFNNTAIVYDDYLPIIKLIEQQVHITPNNIAYIYNEEKYTYQWINNKANGLATILLNNGISKNTFIPIFLEKGIEMPVVLLAIMKTGNAFIPIDINEPENRLKMFFQDINPKYVITVEKYVKKIKTFTNVNIIYADLNDIDEVNINPDVAVSLDDPIYGIYTSGTTGVPKCAINLHKGITNRFKYMDYYFGKSTERIVYHGANYIFDTSVYQFFWALTNGAKVIIPVSSGKLNVDSLLDLIEKYHATYIDLVPSIFNVLVNYFENDTKTINKFSSIKELSIGGEAISPVAINKFLKIFKNIKITNIYGPTETAIGVTFYDVNKHNKEIPIGKPISNVKIYIIDKYKNQVPIGMLGEIYIGGECVGLGYLNDKSKTEKQFIQSPFNDKEILYKTGDLGCYLLDGNIIFKGRLDEQVKIRGVRIELEEIRTYIKSCKNVKDAVVVTKNDKNGEPFLVAYVVSENKKLDQYELKTNLSKNLPDIYIPQYIIPISEIPLNANGKINKFALPEIIIQSAEIETEKSGDKLKLLNIWKEVLSIDRLNNDERFYDCGGNSLKALLLKIKIQQYYGIELGIDKILSNPTINTLQQIIAEQSLSKQLIIPVSKKEKYYPLSNQQKRMWLLHNRERGNNSYKMIGVFHIKGKIDLSILQNAWQQIILKHDSLRTRFKVVDGIPVQLIEPNNIVNYSTIISNNIDSDLNKIIEIEKEQSYDLSKESLFNINIITDNISNTKMILHFNHIITDGWSTKIILNELSKIYNTLAEGKKDKIKKPKIQYKDYCVWGNNLQGSDLYNDAKVYWENKLSDYQPITFIQNDYPISDKARHIADVSRFKIDLETMGKIHSLCKTYEITPFMFFVSVVEIVLSKYTHSEEVILGTPVSGRSVPELTDQVGLYVNTIVLKNKIEKNQLFVEFLASLKHDIIEALKYQDYPYEQLTDKHKGLDLFEVFLSYEGLEDEIKLKINNADVVYEEIANIESKFNINIMIKENIEGIDLVVEFAKDKYKKERISLLESHINNVIKTVINDPSICINKINILDNQEKEQILKYSYYQKEKENKWQSVIDQFKEVAKLKKNNKAVSDRNKYLTYYQLDKNSDKIAALLVNTLKIKKESVVGLLTTKSVEMITAMLGILKAGAAYLPLDIKNSNERLRLILEDSGCEVVLSDLADNEKVLTNWKRFNITTVINSSESKEFTAENISPNQLAYVIYTSGSTGTPKGVMIEHHSLSNLIKSLRNEVYDQYGDSLQVALQASQVFDASVQQIFPSLVRGDTLHLISDETKLNGKLVSELFDREKIAISDYTPILFDIQLQTGFGNNKLQYLKHLLIGGEQLQVELITKFYSTGLMDNVKILNVYGPTECCVDTICYPIDKNGIDTNDVIPIGRPMLNTNVLIMDDDLNIMPLGIPGELYIGGENVGRGYINNEEITKSKFIENPFDKELILYRTGDLCSLLYDGNIKYHGRIDNQIKIRGYRVELGEIENVIKTVLGNSVLVAVYDNNNKEIVVFIENKRAINNDYNKAFSELRKKLPEYMVPAKFIEIKEIPINSSGKPDRNKLQLNIDNYEVILPTRQFVAPKSPTEKALLQIWREVLNVDEISIHDNFFELGGHSIKSLKIMMLISKRFGVELNYKDILTNTTISKMALLIDSINKINYKPIKVIKESEYYELSPAQKRIWLECEMGKSAAYNIFGVFKLIGKLDIEVMQKSIKKVFERHEALRTKIIVVGGKPKQIIESEHGYGLEIIEPKKMLPTKDIIQEEITKLESLSLNIYEDNLATFKLLRINEQENYIFALVHHIVTDGWSNKIMLDEISKIYNSYVNGKLPELDNLKIQYKDYSNWINKEMRGRNYKNHEVYWRGKIKEKFKFSGISKENIVKVKEMRSVNQIQFVITKNLTEAIRMYSIEKEVTIFTFLIYVLEILLHKYTNAEEIILGTPVSGRNHPDLAMQLGLFINTILLRNSISPKSKCLEHLTIVKNEVIEAYNHQDYPFDMLMEKVSKRSGEEIFDVFMSYENIENEIKLTLENIETEYLEIGSSQSKFNFNIIFKEKEENIIIICEYRPLFYSENRVRMFGEEYISIAEQVINSDDSTIEEIKLQSGDFRAIQNNDLNINNAVKEPGNYSSPKSKIEKEIAVIWKIVLKVKHIGIQDNFFELGGQSIKALQLLSSIKEKYNTNFEINFVFANQTIKEQAKAVENALWINKAIDGDDIEEIII